MEEKPFRSIDEQIEILRSRGLETDSDTKRILMREGYYSVVNGYKEPFLADDENGGETFIEGTSFGDIYALFLLDRKLRAVTFQQLIRTEAFFRTVCAYTFCEHHGHGDSYLKADSLSDKEEYRSFRLKDYDDNLFTLQRELRRALDHPRNESVTHYQRKYGEVPFWVLANTLSFGVMRHFFNFMKPDEQRLVCRRIAETVTPEGMRPEYLDPSRLRRIVDVLSKFRNICAHDERLYCAKVGKRNPASFVDCVLDAGWVMDVEEGDAFVANIANAIEEYAAGRERVGDILEITELSIFVDDAIAKGRPKKRKPSEAPE